MARARNIKPGFFTNEDLVELDFATRLLFAGLWTVADREGRLQDRPKKIKIDVFPADNLDIDAMLQCLHGAGFIVRYEVNGVRYIQIRNWTKHQNPHHTERASEIPGQDGEFTVKASTSTRQHQERDGGNLADSGFTDSLIPDSGFTDTASSDAGDGAARPKGYTAEFEAAWTLYPSRAGASKADAFKAWKARLKERVSPSQLTDGVARYAAYCQAMQTEPQFIKQPATFFGPGKHYENDWIPPPRAAPQGRPHNANKHAGAAAAIWGSADQHGEVIDA